MKIKRSAELLLGENVAATFGSDAIPYPSLSLSGSEFSGDPPLALSALNRGSRSQVS